MKLGDNCYFFQGNSIYKGIVTGIINKHTYFDFLSSNPFRTVDRTYYQIWTSQTGFVEIIDSKVFESIELLKYHLAELEIRKYEIFE